MEVFRGEPAQDTVPWKRTRYLITGLTTAGITLSVATRSTLSIAIVAMTDTSQKSEIETFDWDLPTQSTLLSSFFWGYLASNVPSGILIKKFGARWFFFGSLLITGLSTIVIPAVANEWGWQGVCVFRVLLGLSQGIIFPAYAALLAKWATPAEVGQLGSVGMTGMQLGSILALSIGGVLANSSSGWPSMFYLFGGLCIGWCVLWFFLGFDSPSNHPYIIEQEKEFILSSYSKQREMQTLKTPWKDMALSIPLWSVPICVCAQNFGYYMILNELPTYMKNVMHYNIQDNGTLMAMPYVAMLLLIFAFGWCSDVLIDRNLLSLKWARKLFATIGYIGPMAAMIGLSYLGIEERDLAVALLIVSSGLNAGTYVSVFFNSVEIAPNFASILMGISNATGAIISLVVPFVVAAVVQEEGSEEEWQILFWISGGVYLVGCLVYVFFSSNEVQPWNNGTTEDLNPKTSKHC